MARRAFVTWTRLGTQFGNCDWALIDGHITVRTATGSRTAKLAGQRPENLAALLAWQLANETVGCCA